MTMVTCGYCGVEFDNTNGRKNRKYCSKEHAAAASNEATKRRYAENKKRANKKCKVCGSKLSRYNKDTICALCQARARNMGDVDIEGIQYDVEEY